jgi:nucleoside-diphosphate-sugar epimerase
MDDGVKKFLFLGSSCIYPKFAAQPMREDALLTGELEPTNQWYAVAKIAGIKMIEAYPAAIWIPGDFADAHQSVRARRQFRSANLARFAGVDPPFS